MSCKAARPLSPALVERLGDLRPGVLGRLEEAIDQQISSKNRQRSALGKSPLEAYFRDFALLQEVTKAACSCLCDGITVVHTASTIYPFSVTSFYTVGRALGTVSCDDMVAYAGDTDS